MTSPPSPLHGRSQTELMQLSRDAMRRVCASSGDAVPVPNLVERLGLLSDLLGGLIGALEGTRDELWRRERAGAVGAVGGIFVGDPNSALTTMNLWTGRACASVSLARGAVDNAHVATAGLADAH